MKDKNVCPVCGNNLVKGGDGEPYCERCVMEYGEWGEKLEEKIKMEREEGYYWVKLNEGEDWQPAEWVGGVWLLIGGEIYYEDTGIAEAGEEIREPEKEEKKW